MATTGTQVLNKSMALIDEITDSGVINSSDYIRQAPYIIDMLQKELIQQGDLYGVYEFANKPAYNELGDMSNFDIDEFKGTELTYVANSPCKAYYFDANMNGTAYIEDYTDGWNTLATVTINGGTEAFVAYKGVVTPTSGATKSRIRFTGSYRYLTRNRAIFNIPFSSQGEVPQYSAWIKKTMPADFKSMDEIINENEVRVYQKQNVIKWEGRKDLYISYSYDGYIRIQYRPVPAEITSLSQTLQIDDVTASTVLPYGLASQLMVHEDPAKSNYFQQRYDELKNLALQKQPAGEEVMQDYYGLSSWG